MIARQGLWLTILLVLGFAASQQISAAESQEDQPPAKKTSSATGTWKWTFTTRNGQTRDSIIKLNQTDNKLTGIYVGRNDQEVPIENGQIQNGELSFTITRQFNNRTFVAKYTGKLTGDVIKGTIETTFNDRTRTRDWQATREKPSATGTWTWAFNRQDGSAVEFALKLVQDGEKLTGVSIINNDRERTIEQGKIVGNELSFVVAGEREGRRWSSQFRGQLNGDTIKGTITAKWSDQERTFDWEAKRSKD